MNAVVDLPTIRIHPADDVVIARRQLIGGTVLPGEGVTVLGLVPAGHKVAAHAIPAGAPVRRYNQIIGTAKVDIAAGQHVHTHNLEFSDFVRDYAVGADARAIDFVVPPAAAAFPCGASGSGKWPTRHPRSSVSTPTRAPKVKYLSPGFNPNRPRCLHHTAH